MLDKIRTFIYLSITQIQKSSFNISYEKMLETLQGIEQKSNFRNQHRLPRMSDIEVPTLFLTAKYMGIDSEYRLFRMLPDYLRPRIERSVYNRCHRPLPPPICPLFANVWAKTSPRLQTI